MAATIIKLIITSARKTLREPPFTNLVRDFLPGGITDCTRHTIDSHWLRFRESPTNINLFPLNLSNSNRASNLYIYIHQLINAPKTHISKIILNKYA